jgi:hypothetical protein|tara:strand:+ start:1044 stop:1811 length:768 start_codon:yes stop_codon:yes gene_type:complete
MKNFSRRILMAGEPTPLRIVLVVLGVLVVVTPLVFFARWLVNQPTLIAVVNSSLAGIISAFLLASIVEWSVHRYAMHRSKRLPLFRLATELHHKAHHWVHVPPNRYVQAGPINRPSVLASDKTVLCQSTFVRIVTTLSHAAFYIFLTMPILLLAWVVTLNIWFTVSMVSMAAVFIYLFIRIHDAVHHPGLSRLEYFQWFWFLDHHHYIHHIDNDANTNFLLPLGDLLMGTLRLELTAEELDRWPSYAEARTLLDS